MLTIENINPDYWLSIWIAVKFAEKTLCIFEKEHPDNNDFHRAIDAAKVWLNNPCEETRNAARSACDSAYRPEEAKYTP